MWGTCSSVMHFWVTPWLAPMRSWSCLQKTKKTALKKTFFFRKMFFFQTFWGTSTPLNVLFNFRTPIFALAYEGEKLSLTICVLILWASEKRSASRVTLQKNVGFSWRKRKTTTEKHLKEVRDVSRLTWPFLLGVPMWNGAATASTSFFSISRHLHRLTALHHVAISEISSPLSCLKGGHGNL